GDEGRGPGRDPITGANPGLPAGLVVLPGLLPGGLVEGDEELAFAGAGPEDDEVLIKDGRRGVPPDVPELAEAVGPLLLAGEVVAIKARGAEADDDPLTVGDGRGGAVGAGGVLRLLVVVRDDLFPETLAVGPVKAPQGPLFPLGVERLREEDALTPHDRG